MTTRARRRSAGVANVAPAGSAGRAVDYEDLAAWALLITRALTGLPSGCHERIRDWWSRRVAAHLGTA